MESVRLREYERKTQMRANELELYRDSFVLVPYQVSGYIDVTNRGITNSPQRPQDFETFKRVWTGNDAVVINWKNSMVFTQNPNTINKDFEVKYKLGEVLLGRIEEDSADVSIENDESFSQYKSQQSEGILRFRIDKYFSLTDEYNFYFWKIPEISGSTLYRVERIEKDYVGNNLVGYVLSLKTLNQDISNTGRAKQQNVMPSAPGQGYLECIVEDKDWPKRVGEEAFNKLVEGVDYYKFYDRYITADFNKTLNNPVYSVVVKCFGNTILNSVTMFGRPVERGDKFNKFREPRILFPINLSNPQTLNFYNTQNNESNFYFGNFKPELLYHKEWRDWVSGLFNPLNTYKFEGVVEFDSDKVQVTNPTSGSGKYTNNLYGDLKENVREPWNIVLDEQNIDTSTVLGTTPTYKIYKEPRAIHDHLFDNYWTQKNMKTLPMTSKSSLSYGNTLTSILGGNIFNPFNIFTLIAIGMKWSADRYTNKADFVNYRGIVSAPVVDLNVGQAGKNKLMLNVFDNNANSPSGIFFSNQTMNVSFQANLTDRFVDNKTPNLNKKTLSTLNIGQTIFEDGTPIKSDNSQYLLSGGTQLVTSESGYIIDYIQIQAMGKFDISIEFLDNVGNVVWTGIYQSEGKWTDSFREIWTEKFTSVFGRENTFWSEKQPYPKMVQPSKVERPVFENIEIPKQKLLRYNHYNWGDDPVWYFTSDTGYWVATTFNLKTNLTYKWLNNGGSGNVVDNYREIKHEIIKLNQVGMGSWDDFKTYYGSLKFDLENYCQAENISTYTGTILPDINVSKNVYSQELPINEDYKIDTWYSYSINVYNNTSKNADAKVEKGGCSAEYWMKNDFDNLDYKFTIENDTLYLTTRYRLKMRGSNVGEWDKAPQNQTHFVTSGLGATPNVFSARIERGGGTIDFGYEQSLIVVTRQRT